MSRRELLLQFLADHPSDAFARYGLAMEEAGAGNVEQALAEFARLRTDHPDYVAGYHQAAQLLLARERRAEAREQLQSGLAAAERQGDRHAASEMQALLDEMGG